MISGTRTPRRLLPLAILVAGVFVTGVAAWFTGRSTDQGDRFGFENAADRVRAGIESRIDAYIAMLLGGAGLFAGSEDVQLPEFRAYVDRLELQRRYPGIQGIGFSRVVRPEERESVARQVRRHLPSFAFQSGEVRQVVHAILYLEPQDELNRRALGYDMFADPTRQAAMIRARDTGMPAASQRVELVQELEVEPAKRQAGFLIYVPVYRGGDVPQTIEERRERLVGFVYSPFRSWDLFRPSIEAVGQELTFDVYDGKRGDARPLHVGGAGAPVRFATERAVSVAGSEWTLAIRSGPAYAASSGRLLVLLVAIVGTLLSALLYRVTTSEIGARQAAERRADELRRSEEALREANRAKDEFLAVVSHELRTPLNAILGWAGMLRRGQVPAENQAHALTVIERNAAAQARLVEELLDLSRAVAGRLNLQLGDIDVGPALRSAVDAMAPAAAAAGVTLTCEVPDDLGRVRADHARLHQIVLNLLSNGIKFTPAGGRVTLAASRGRDRLRVEVTDTGAGISRDFLPHVFERFRQADTSLTRTHGGVGLGLAISRHLVELHGGCIILHSDGPGHGTTAAVELPALRSPEPALAGTPSRGSRRETR